MLMESSERLKRAKNKYCLMDLRHERIVSVKISLYSPSFMIAANNIVSFLYQTSVTLLEIPY